MNMIKFQISSNMRKHDIDALNKWHDPFTQHHEICGHMAFPIITRYYRENF